VERQDQSFEDKGHSCNAGRYASALHRAAAITDRERTVRFWYRDKKRVVGLR